MTLQNSPSDILFVNSKKVSCNGEKGSSRHPLVYLNMGKKDHVICPYCGKYFTNNHNYLSTIEKNKKNKI